MWLPLAVAAASGVLLSAPCLHSQSESTVATSEVGPALADAAPAATAARLRISRTFGRLPISFEVNQGQAAGPVQHLARGSGYNLFLTPGEKVLTLHASARAARNRVAKLQPPREDTEMSAAVRMPLIGSNKNAQALGIDPIPGKSNYFVGVDPAKWPRLIDYLNPCHLSAVFDRNCEDARGDIRDLHRLSRFGVTPPHDGSNPSLRRKL